MNRLIMILLVASLIGCSDEPQPNLEIVVLSGGNLNGLQRESVSVEIVVKDASGGSQPGLELEVTPSEGGSIGNQELKTDNQGTLKIDWVLGDSYSQSLQIELENGQATGKEVLATAHYVYTGPQKVEDQWEVGSLDLSHAGTSALMDGIDEIRNGNYNTFHSVLIVHDKKLVLEEYFPGENINGQLINYDMNTLHVLESASKSVRSAFIGIAIDQGYISSEQEKLFSFFPEHSSLVEEDPLKGEITLEHVLTMSSGLEWNENLVPFGENNTLPIMYSLPEEQRISYLLNQPMEYNPGATWNYNTGASIMLRNIIENTIDIDIDQFLETHYWNLIGAPIRTASGYRQTPREMAKLGYIYLYDGMWNEKRVISSSWIQESTKPHFLNVAGSAGYGYQWWLREFISSGKSYSSFHASGNGGQYIVVIKELDLAVIITGGNFGQSSIPFMTSFISDHVIPAFVQ